MRFLFVALTAAAMVGGCATTADCDSDSYQLGWRDGRYGSFPQAELYAKRCPGIDVGRYNEGWRDGNSARPSVGASS